MTAPSPARASPDRLFAEQTFSRTAGAPLLGGNSVHLLIDGAAHFDAWLQAIRAARDRVLLENYMVGNDDVGRAFRDALVERARAGVTVAVLVDWLGCLGQSGGVFWETLRSAGGLVRLFNPPRLGEPFGWLSRDHRKLLVVDGAYGSVSGVCLSAKWLGNRKRREPPWRDTGVAVRGPAVAELEAAFVQSWNLSGTAFDGRLLSRKPAEPEGSVALRVIATQPSTAGVFRLDQLVASLARRTLWLSDAYFVGITPYVYALIAAAHDGVDVRMLVPGTSDIPVVANLSRVGYRPLLKAGIRVFEWNGSMLHAKTAVADGKWARVGSSNLNLASWMGNLEIDVAMEDADFAGELAAQFERDLDNATEIVLTQRPNRRSDQVRSSLSHSRPRGHMSGTPGRAAAGALRLANSVGAALANPRVLGDVSSGPLLVGAVILAVFAVIGLVWPASVGWPFAALALWFSLNLTVRLIRQRRRPRRDRSDDKKRD